MVPGSGERVTATAHPLVYNPVDPHPLIKDSPNKYNFLSGRMLLGRGWVGCVILGGGLQTSLQTFMRSFRHDDHVRPNNTPNTPNNQSLHLL